ncbi:MAG: type II secretion system protein GspL, partial [Gammaproteobacteria bacterium]
AALLVAGLVLALVSVGVESYRLSQQQKALTAQIEQLYKQTFPNAKRVVNARAQMEQQLKQLQRQTGTGQTDFIVLLGETGSILKRTQGVEISSASFRDGRLDLELAADNLQILDKLKQELVASGRLQAEIQSATTEAGQKVKSRVRVEGAQS